MHEAPHRFLRVIARLVFAVACMAVASPAFAQPQWIAPGPSQSPTDPCPLLRREFTLDRVPPSAKVRVVGLGHYELRCNGKIVGDTVINQPWSQYDKTIYSQEFDLAPYLAKGKNVVAVSLGNSFWCVRAVNDPARFAKTDAMPDFSAGNPYLLWMDGAVQSDASWTWSAGPLTFSHIYAGEDYDARLEQPGWDSTAFNVSAWKPVRLAEAPKARVVPTPAPGMRTFDVFAPTEIRRPVEGFFTYVFPQNCSALLRFTVDGGKAGDRIRFRPCEYMDDGGKIHFTYTWGTKKDIWHDYTKKSSGQESHQVIFCYVGAQFVEIEGAVPEGDPNPRHLPVIKLLEQVHVRAACPDAGSFDSSSDMQDKAESLALWSIRSNMAHVPTDCPHREKNGWLEQNWHMARSLSYCFDVRSWLTKSCIDMASAQQDDGHVPTNSPNYLIGVPPHGYWNNSAEWGIAAALVPWHLYEWYGDREAVALGYDAARKYVDYLSSTAKDGLITSNLGDWYDFGHGKGNGPSQWTPNEVSATAVWAMGARAVSRMAGVLGKEKDQAAYDALYTKIRGDFIRAFYDSNTKTFKNGGSCQGANSTALAGDLFPEEDRAAIVDAIVKDLASRGYQQTTGEVLHVFLIRALAENGRGDVLHRVYARDGVGSYAHMVASGLTTLPESWDAHKGTGDSLNHFMLGQLVEWHHAYVCGIRQAAGSIGWKKVLIAPQPPARALLSPAAPPPEGTSAQNFMSSASASLRVPQGSITSSWKIEGGQFHLSCSVPEGVDAEVLLPDGTRHPLPAGSSQFSCAAP